jgi:hypothetical protein
LAARVDPERISGRGEDFGESWMNLNNLGKKLHAIKIPAPKHLFTEYTVDSYRAIEFDKNYFLFIFPRFFVASVARVEYSSR